MRRYSIILVAIVLFVLTTVTNSFAVSCHCFQDRSFDPSRPEAADPYFLATVQNSLIAAALSVSKRSIVQAKMGGADADLLWVAYYVSDRSGIEIEDALSAWMDGGMTGLSALLVKSADKFDAPFVMAMKDGPSLESLADGAFRSVMISQVDIDATLLASLSEKQLKRKEQVMALFLSLLLAENPLDLYESVAGGQSTWGQLLDSTGIDPGQIEETWRKLIRAGKG